MCAEQTDNKCRKAYVINNYHIKRIQNRLLITTDCGTWLVLDKKSYDSVIRHEPDEELFRLLEQKCIILTERNTEILLAYQQNRLHFLFGGVGLHIIIPTLRCNQKCIYCHSSAAKSSEKERDMDQDTAKKTLDFIFQTPAKSITVEFQGGDSLMNFELFKYIVTTAKELNQQHKKNIRFELVTNLTLMNEEYFDWIVKEDINISTSLDGPKELHDKIRKYENGTGTYDDVVNWLARFNEKGKRLGVLMVTTRYSLPYWKEIIDEYVRWGITNIQIKPLNKLGFAEKTWEEIGYTTEEFLEFWKKCVDYILELNKKGIEIRERYINLILDKLFTIRDPAFLDFRSPCGTVIGQLAYNYNGDIYSCDEGRNYEMFKLGNVKTDSYADIIVKDQSKMLVSSTILENFMCDACAYKPFCGSCPVISYAEDNNIISKLAKSSKCKMFKSKFDYVFQKIINEKWPSQT